MKFATKLMTLYPPHLRHVATLPWETKKTRCLISRGRFFSGSSYPNEDIAKIEGLRDVDMATNFGTTLAANGL